jgi:hypothetical protein
MGEACGLKVVYVHMDNELGNVLVIFYSRLILYAKAVIGNTMCWSSAPSGPELAPVLGFLIRYNRRK